MYVSFPQGDHTGNAQTEQGYVKLFSISWSTVTNPADAETEQRSSIGGLDPKVIPILHTDPALCLVCVTKAAVKTSSQQALLIV